MGFRRGFGVRRPIDYLGSLGEEVKGKRVLGSRRFSESAVNSTEVLVSESSPCLSVTGTGRHGVSSLLLVANGAVTSVSNPSLDVSGTKAQGLR